ncbi:colibactin non-ribosomal peptide synthetase ClbJ [Serratia nevei]|uniref:colibactin non-ribosomal peptide synthetase ClbJ n=1 Tax=Serratia nevei TaxID=2703794 RepID=UPI00209EB0F3|nr:colibactin non-ribosomal peptide synthetase ClbJ [Serratia nevei]MCP1104250.1 colibactin non-ribosomal peptide synthetase ClbJ [Serratia nevei]
MTIQHAALARTLPADKKERLLRQLAQSGVSPSRIPIIKADPAQAIPLSFNQERLWFLQQYDNAAINYNLYVVYRLHGVVDIPRLTQALRRVQARHAILRTRIVVRNDRPCQVIDDAPALIFDTVTLAAQAPDSARDAAIQRVTNTRFDLAHGPLWGVTQIVQPGQDSHLVFCVHHIVIDGISLRLLFDELQQQYARLLAGDETSLPPLPLQYADYACWQREWFQDTLLATELAHWRARLQDAPLLSTFPSLHPRPAQPSAHGARFSITLDAALSRALKRVASAQETTPFVLMLTAFQLVLMRYAQQQRLVMGTPVSGRIRPELQNSIGYYASTAVICTDFSGVEVGRDALQRVKASVKETLGRQQLPFESLVNALDLPRSLSHSPLFQILYIYHNHVTPRAFPLAGAHWEQVTYHNQAVKYDMTVEVFQNDATFDVAFEFNLGLYDADVVQQIAEALRQHCLALTSSLEVPIAAIPLQAPEAATPQRDPLNATDVLWPAPQDVLRIIEQRCVQHPTQLAIQQHNGTLTYAALWARVQAIAARFQAQGIQPGDRVGVLLPRHSDVIATLLATWYVGACYVPFDLRQPPARLQRLMQRARLACLVVRQPGEWGETAQLSLPESMQDTPNVALLPAPCALLPDTQAYLLFTSGSTGEPKGVRVVHRGLLNLLLDMQRTFAVGPNDRLLSVTTPTFDISFLEYLLPLISGASLYLTEAERAADSFRMISLIADYQPTLMQATPSFWHGLLTAGWRGDPQLCVLAGGEALPTKVAEELLRGCGALWNLYGPTETTIWSLKAQITQAEYITLGVPIANTRVYILDEEGHPVPRGVDGELYIAGDGVAHGYDGQPELSAQRFLSEPGYHGGRMFRTGDLVRCDVRGQLCFVGRKDSQIKLRGYRIELGEIERTLARHPHVDGAVVACIESAPLHKALAAFIVTSAPLSLFEQLKNDLRQQLPDYMVPTLWQRVTAFPNTANGKIDRKRLAADFVAEEPLAPPPALSDAEQALLALWRRYLPITNAGPECDFFRLGGHSLLAVALVAEVNRTFHCALTLKDIFHYSTLRALSARIVQQSTTDAAAPQDGWVMAHDPEHRHQPFPLTDVQRAYWLGRQAGATSVATHVYHEFDVEHFDVARFTQAVNALIARHEMLRARVLPDGTQQILAQVPTYQLEQRDLRALPPGAHHDALMAIRDRLSHHVHPAEHWPLFDFSYSACTARQGRLHFSLDLLIADALSMRTLQQELMTLYRDPHASLPRLPFSFRDYVQALLAEQAGEAYARDRAYWQQALPQLYGPPALPVQGDLAQLPAIRFVRRHHRLSAHDWGALSALAQRARITKTALLLTVFSQVLARWSLSPTFTLNLTLFNRPLGYPNAEAVIGDFTAVSLLNVCYDSQQAYAHNAQRIQAQLWEDLEHRRFSGIRASEALIRSGRFPAPMPVVFTSMVDTHEETPAQAAQDTTRFTLCPDANITQTPQVWLDHQVMEQAGELHFNWDAVAQLFDASLLDQMFGAYCHALQALVTAPQGWRVPNSSLALPAVCAPVTQAPAPTALLHHGLLRQAALTPQATALISPARELTYCQLSTAADNVAGALFALGVRHGDRVAVVMEKGWQQIAAVHGILRLGAVYLPVDPALPPQRRQLLLTAGEVRVQVTQPGLAALAPSLPALAIDDGMLDAPATPLPSVAAEATDLAYIIFTSGSTGTPKGVMLDHRAAMNTLEDINERFGLNAQDRLFGLSSLSFDLSVYDAFAPFMVGAALVLPEAGREKDPRHWQAVMAHGRVSVWNAVPALMQMLCEYHGGDRACYPTLRLALLSGDWIPLTLPGQMRERLNEKMAIISLGGATECAIWSVYYPIAEVEPAWSGIPYGRGLRNQPMYVLNAQLEECPVGVEGEICIGGMGLAQGYLNDAEKTAASFVWREASGERVYRTGDRGRYFADGQIAFLGRNDTQVKVNGFRVELGEVKSHLERLDRVGSAAVVCHQGQLHAFITAAENEDVDDLLAHVRAQLAAQLPYYLLPQHLFLLNVLPMTGNGKIDQAALAHEVTQRMSQSTPQETATLAHASPCEQQVAALWCEVLQRERIGLNDNFFEAGGGSIQIVLLHRRIEEIFKVTVPIAELFRLTTVKKIAGYLQATLDGAQMVNQTQQRDVSQSRAQQRLVRRHQRQR